MEIYKGDIFYIKKANNTIGSEQQAGRPAIVVSNNIGNEHSKNVSIVYLTTQSKKSLPTHVQVKAHALSTALCEQIYTVSKERVGNYIRSLNALEMAAIENAIMLGLGIEHNAPFTEYEVENDQLKRNIDSLKYELEDRMEQADELRKLVEKQEKEIEELKQSDKVVILPDNVKTESETQLVFERNFYKTQYEALFEQVIRKAVQV